MMRQSVLSSMRLMLRSSYGRKYCSALVNLTMRIARDTAMES